MGSTDSDCCGSKEYANIKPETDSTRLKHMRANQFNPNTDEKQQYPASFTSSASPSPNTDTSESSYKSQSNKKKKKKGKRKYSKLKTQIGILCSENARAQSLLLCSKPEMIRRDGTVKEFGFLKYLETNLSYNSMEELYHKLNPKAIEEGNKEHVLSISSFITFLTWVVIIYRMKLHQLRYATKETPKFKQEKIKTSIEHLAMWCVRNFGRKQNTKKYVMVLDDMGNEIKGEYDIYKFSVTLNDFTQNIPEWVAAYCQVEGRYDLTNDVSLP